MRGRPLPVNESLDTIFLPQQPHRPCDLEAAEMGAYQQTTPSGPGVSIQHLHTLHANIQTLVLPGKEVYPIQ